MDLYQDRTSHPRRPVASSSLASIGYDAASRILDVEFRKGSVYRYFEVLPSVHEALLLAPSKGRFFVTEVRDRFPYTRVSHSISRG
ncbi:MAG: KTSC domain-containing protein [Armatimonadetes bacterium]|nr:KTSC domain-containing protein [Armatimonadota bacterium]